MSDPRVDSLIGFLAISLVVSAWRFGTMIAFLYLYRENSMIRTTCLTLFALVAVAVIGCGGKSPKELLTGRWKAAGDSKGLEELDITSDGKVVFYAGGEKQPTMSWQVKEEKDSVITFTVTDEKGEEGTMTFEFSDDDNAKVTVASRGKELRFTVARTTGPRPIGTTDSTTLDESTTDSGTDDPGTDSSDSPPETDSVSGTDAAPNIDIDFAPPSIDDPFNKPDEKK